MDLRFCVRKLHEHPPQYLKIYAIVERNLLVRVG